jgi:N-methylhydantoinase A/oxoprolinase/acetone carboxylase beta subunit
MTLQLSLGIDAGGTYTDVILLDQATGRVVGRYKSPTTRPDPSGGIAEGLSGLDSQMLNHVQLVSVATTFATNAIVEGVGSEAGLILIGYDAIPSVIPNSTKIMMLKGGHTASGQEKDPLDIEQLDSALPTFIETVDAIAVAGFFSVRNPDHEKRTAKVIRERYHLPVVTGHRLSMKLDSIKRATTAWWNARLIPLISKLVHACQQVLHEHGVSAPLMVVRGDGTLMSADAALDRPVDTLLSGPAASILGAKHLAGIHDCLIVDMGGTTTDIAVLRNDRVVIDSIGARVGSWETHVEAAKVRTIGLGGDSYIQINGERQISIGPRRVIPLCVQADRNPKIVETLRSIHRNMSSEICKGLNPCTFYIGPEGILISAFEVWTDACQWKDLLHLAEEERRGRYSRSSLTPTDVRVAAGKLDLGSAEAARLGRSIMARYLSISEKELGETIEGQISRMLCSEVVEFLGGQQGDALSALVPNLHAKNTTEEIDNVTLEVSITLTAPVIGLGAPAPSCLPQAFRLLNAETILPPGYDVSVAIGAVVGLVELRFNGMIRPIGDGKWDLHTAAGKESLSDFATALATGRVQLEELAREDMKRNWVESPLIRFRYSDQKIYTAGGEELHLQTELLLIATGRPNVQDR